MDDGTPSQKIRHFSTLAEELLQAEFQNSQPAAIDCHRVMIFTKSQSRERISQVVLVVKPKAWKTQ